MSVPNTTSAVRYTGNGATSTYAYTWYIQDDDDLEVSVTTTGDVNTVLTKTTHYTVSGALDPDGGSITLLSPYNNLTSGYILAIRLKPALNSSSSFRNASRIAGSAIEDALDRASQRQIRQQDELDRCIKLPVHEAGTETKTHIGDAAARASKYLGFDSSGNPTLTSQVSSGSLTVSAFGESLIDDANAGAALTTLGVAAFAQTILDDTTAGAVQTTLGITAAAQSILDDASVAAIRTTLGLDGASGVLAALDLADAATAQIFQARLTLTSGTAVTTADVAAAGTIYLTPYKGNKVAVYTGSRWKLMPLTQISLALTATSGFNYDVWVYDNAGTLTLETTIWTNDTTRATALALQDGVYCKTGALTRRYVGTFRASGANVTEDSVAKRFVWNYYNRAVKKMYVSESNLSWTYTTATPRQANGAASNQLDFVVGVSEDAVSAELVAVSSNSSANIERSVGISLDSTSTLSSVGKIAFGFPNPSSANANMNHYVRYNDYPGAGRHFLVWIEYSVATGTTTWFGSAFGSGSAERCGLIGAIPC